MRTVRLKNIVILLLVLVDSVLLLLLFSRQQQRQNAYGSMVAELVSLFEKNGVALSPDNIPADAGPDTLDLTRDTAQERALAQAILGDVSTVDAGGGVYRYFNPSGTCLFRTTGAFDCNVASLAVADIEGYCRAICDSFGYTDMRAAVTGGTGVVTAARSAAKLPTFNCSITFTFEKGLLTSVTGTYIPSAYTATANENCISALTALTAFLDYRNQTGIVCTEIHDMSIGYLLQSTAAAPLRLIPVWRISTVANEFYVNCLTGEVSHA